MKDIVFQQLLKPLTKKLIQKGTDLFQSDYDCEKFLTWHHIQAMIYAHLLEIKSLSTLETAINSQKIGIGCEIKRSTLSDANQRRPANCFLWILEQLMSLVPRKIRRDIKKVVRILDSSPIQLKGCGYDEWAKAYATERCQGFKLHVEYDLQIKSPTRIALSHPNYNDCSMGQQWPIQPYTIYIFDKGYCDFNWWWLIDQRQAFFVTRLKKGISILMRQNRENISENILEDGTFSFKNKHINSSKGSKKNLYQEDLRRISVYREGKPPLILVTNLFDCAPEIVAKLYKARWEIELFFKWIKQNLKFKKFMGKSANAVTIQIATGLIAYVLVLLYKINSKNKKRLQLILVWLKVNLHTYRPKFKGYSPPVYQFGRSSFVNREVVQLCT